jgi:hypothetical protein
VSHYDPFAADYDTWSADMTEDVAWYVGLAREAGAPIVELAVGSGRVAIPTAHETDVAGLELEGLYGGFAREPFGDDSLELVWVARKPA